MKQSLYAIAIASCLTTPAFAGEDIAETSSGWSIPGEFDSYVTLVSEYSFRGITQTDEGPAIQGGIDWTIDNGFYAGIWGSSVDFNDGDEANVELDFFVGHTHEFEDLGISTDVGFLYYAYPGARSNLNYDFWEVYGSISHDFEVASVSLGLNYSPEYFGDSGESYYYTAGIEVPLPNDLTAVGRIGRQLISDEVAFNAPDYTDWEIGVQWAYQDFAFSLSYIDTNLSTSECADGCDARVVAGVSASF